MIKDKRKYRILVVEDNEGDLALVEDFLSEQIADPFIMNAFSYKQSSVILSESSEAFDVILLDLTLVDKNGQQLIDEMLQIARSCPIIILTGYTDIDFSIRSISKGISDYLLKDDLNAIALYKSILYAIERKKIISDLKESEKRYSDLFKLNPQPTCLYDNATFRFTKINKAAIEQYGYTHDEFLQMTLFDLIRVEEMQKTKELVIGQTPNLNETHFRKSWVNKKSGELVEVETYSTPIIINEKISTLLIAIDVTEKNLYEHKITKAIIKTQEEERYEIGGELHDNVCQILAASRLSLGMLRPSLASDGMRWYNDCNENINLALDEIRNLSHRLAPAFFDGSTLENAFNILLNTFNAEQHYKIFLHFNDALKKYPLTRELQLNLYRILQEGLKNILKYSKASIIEVDAIIYNNKLKMKLSDNGIGFDPGTIKSGIGLANMKRRAELFSGKFEIISSPGKGCVVIADIPLPKPD